MFDALRNDTVARLVEAAIVPDGAVLNNYQSPVPPRLSRAIAVSVDKSRGTVGVGAGYAIDVHAKLVVTCYARGAATDATMGDAVDAMARLVLRALLIDPTYRETWPIAGWDEQQLSMADTSQSVLAREIAFSLMFPINVVTDPTERLLEIGAAYDIAYPGNGPGETPDFEQVLQLEAP